MARERKSQKNNLVVFAGDMFLRTADVERQKAEFALTGAQMMGFDAVALGEYEFVHGLDFLETQLKKYPFFVCANVVWSDTRKPLAKPVLYRTYRLDAAPNRPARSVTVAVFGVITDGLAGTIDSFVKEPTKRIRVLDPIEEARKVVDAARKKAQLVVALAHMDDQKAKELALQVSGIDVIVLGHGYRRKIVEPLKVNSTLLVGESDQGKYVSQLILALDSKGKIEASAGTSVPMDETIPDEPEIAKMYAELKLKWAKEGAQARPTPVTQRTFVGAIGCRGCHKPQYDHWRQTSHARAFAALGQRDKLNQSSPECLPCHTLGFKQKGGFVNLKLTSALTNVQCESCHGPGVRHVLASAEKKKSSIPRKVSAATCQKCHDEPNDPAFNYNEKLRLVKH